MKQTDEERRETAEKLRNMCMGGCRYAEQFYELLKETVMDSWDFHDFPDVAERLADLIEPPFPPCEETEEWLDSIKREGQPKTVRDVIEDIIWTCSTVDIGPNGNVFAGVDEGLVSTDALISTWEVQLADLIEPEQTCRWVSVDDRLPDSEGEFIVAYHPCYHAAVDENRTLVGMDSFRGKTAWAKRKYQRVTHWMPKPEPPKVVEK